MRIFRLLVLASACTLLLSCTSSSITPVDGKLIGVIDIPYSNTFLVSHLSDYSLLLIRDIPDSANLSIERYSASPALLWSTSISDDRKHPRTPVWLCRNKSRAVLISKQKIETTLYVQGRKFNLADGKELEVKTLAEYTEEDSDDVTPYDFVPSPDSGLFAFYRFNYKHAKKRGEVKLEIHTFGADFHHIGSDTITVHPPRHITDVDDLKRLYFNELTLERDTTLYAFHCYPIDTVELWTFRLKDKTVRTTRFTVSEANFDDDQQHLAGLIRKHGDQLTLVSVLSGKYTFIERTISQFLFARIDLAGMRTIDAISIIPEYDQIRNSEFRGVGFPSPDEFILVSQNIRGGVSRQAGAVVNWNDVFILYCDSANGLRWRERIRDISPSYMGTIMTENFIEVFYTRSEENLFPNAGIVHTSIDRETGLISGKQHLLETDLSLAYDGLRMINEGEIICILGSESNTKLTRVTYDPL